MRHRAAGASGGRAALPAVLVLLAVLGGCGGPARERAAAPLVPTSVAVAPLTGTLTQDRLDADAHRITASLTNPGTTPVAVGHVQLAAAQYAPVPPTEWDVVIAPHATLDLWFGYGPARCPASSAGPSLLVTLPSAGGREARVDLSRDPLVPRLARDDCALAAVADAVHLTFAGPWTPRRVDGLPALAGAFRVDRGTAQGAVVVTGYQGSPLYRVAPVPPATAPQQALAAGQDHALLPVLLQVDRCDPHGLTEAKRVFAWRVDVRVGGGPERVGAIEPPAELRTRVHALLADCGTRPVRG